MKVEISIKEATELIKEIEQKPVKILEMVKVETKMKIGGRKCTDLNILNR